MSFDTSLNLSRQHIVTQKSSIISQSFDMRTEDSRKQSKKKGQKKSSQTASNQPAHYEFTEVFVWGDDTWGQLGLYHQKVKKGILGQTEFKLPKTCSFNILINQISCGEAHSAILTNQGHLYMMGSNVEGQLGIGDNCPDMNNKTQAGAPCLVDKLKDLRVTSVKCGSNFTLALAESKSPDYHNSKQKQFVFGWGSNKLGQLGIDEDETQYEQPQQITYFDDNQITLIEISGGKDHSLFVSDKGRVFATGHNNYGQLGISIQNADKEPKLIETLSDYEIISAKAGHGYSLFLTIEGEVLACGNNQNLQLGISDITTSLVKPQKVQGLQKIRQIEASTHSAAISFNGELYLWGTGVFGQYKTPQKILTISNRVEHVSLGDSLGAAIDCKGLLWSWGYNQHGELGVGDNDPRIHPYPVLSLKGKVVTSISCGGSFVVALGSNIKKEIPGLNLKKEKETSKGRVGLHQRHSSQKNLGGGRSLSQSKKKNSSVKNLHRQSSTSSISKIYGRDQASSGIVSPKMRGNLGSVLQKRHSKSSLHKQDQSKSKIKIKTKGSQSKPPFSGEDTTVIKSTKLNSSGLLIKKKNLSLMRDSVSSPTSKKHSLRPEPLDFVNSNDITSESQSMGVMFIPSALQTQTNKEKIIKDLTTENKQLKAEQEIYRKENRQLKIQVEQLEKQLDRSKHNQQHQQEVQMLYAQLKKKELKISELKKKKREFKGKYNETQGRLERVLGDRDCFQAERDHMVGQVSTLQQEYQKLQQRLVDAQIKNQTYETEIKEFEGEISKISQHSQEVEKSLLSKLHEVSEKYRETMKQVEDLQAKSKQDSRKIDELNHTIKDTQYYVSAVEKENAFLREEIEKAKYSKDKSEYGKFVQNLLPIRGKKGPQQDENVGTASTRKSEFRSPFKDQTQTTNVATTLKSNFQDRADEVKQLLFHARKSSMEHKVEQQLCSPKEVKVQEEPKQVQETSDFNELKLSYNQKLLKSLEKKTLPKYR